jgi:hypothetical protein
MRAPFPGTIASGLRFLRTGRLLLAVLAALSTVASAKAQPEFTDENLEQWVFQQHGTAEGARQSLNSELLLQIEYLDRTSKLTPEQKEKLKLMGRGDIQHFFDRYHPLKEKLRAMHIKQNEPDFQQKWQKMWQEISPVQMTLQAGLFKKDSLFEKSLISTLTAAQLEQRAAVDKERREFRKRAKIALAVTMFEQSLPLREEQRRRLIALLDSEMQPVQWQNGIESVNVLGMLVSIPEAKVKPLFDDAQWKAVQREMGRFGKQPEGIIGNFLRIFDGER